MKFKSLVYTSAFFLTLCSYSQSNLLNAKTPDEIGQKSEAQLNADNDKPLPYGYVHDRDILFGKRVWEVIDLNERMNFPLYFPTEDDQIGDRKSLYIVLSEAIKAGAVTDIYTDEYFTSKKSFEDVQNSLYLRELNEYGITTANSYQDGRSPEQLEKDGILNEEMFSTTVINPSDITKYQVVGFWYFDKRQAEMKYRILGIAPMALSALDKARNNVSAEPLPLFWVFFPSVRDILHDAKAFNDRNSAMPISFDHLLNSRRFSAVIIKEENVYGDRAVKEYMAENALNQLLESKRILEKIRDIEQDMWNY